MTKRIINLGGGTYNANIEGNYIQGQKRKEPEPKMKSAKPPDSVGEASRREAPSSHLPRGDAKSERASESDIDTNGANYTESLGGKVIDGDVIQSDRRGN